MLANMNMHLIGILWFAIPTAVVLGFTIFQLVKIMGWRLAINIFVFLSIIVAWFLFGAYLLEQ